MEATRVYLERVTDGELVEADLLDEISDHHLNLWQSTWKSALADAVARMKEARVPRACWPQDLHWDWNKKTVCARSYIGMRSFCIVCDGQLQGMMQLDCTREGRLSVHAGKPIVYIDFLSTAPWNRKELVQLHQYRGVGRVLILAAIQLSIHEEFQGRIGLHSLPQADEFYAGKCGMTSLGNDARYENLTYFEMTVEQAAEFLRLKK